MTQGSTNLNAEQSAYMEGRFGLRFRTVASGDPNQGSRAQRRRHAKRSKRRTDGRPKE